MTGLDALHLDGRTVRLCLQGGPIGAVDPVDGSATGVVPPLPLDPHVDLDKTHVIDRCAPAAPGQFAAMAGDIPRWAQDDVRHRMTLALEDAWANSVRALRSHIDWGVGDAPLTARHGMAGQVLSGHASSLSIRAEAGVRRMLDAAARAGFALTVMPTTNGYLQDNHPGRPPRLQEALAAAMEVLLGADNVRDPFFPFGSYDPLDSHRQAVLTAQLDPAKTVPIMTTAPALVLTMCLTPGRTAAGEPADFSVIAANDWPDAISPPSAARQIYRAGQPDKRKPA